MIQLFVVLLLTALNAFFALSEMAYVSFDEMELEQIKNPKKREFIKEIKQDPTDFLASIQVGITLAGFFSSATVAVALSGPLGSLLSRLGVIYPEELAMIFVTIVLSFFVLVFGELVPKRIALLNPVRMVRLSAHPIHFLMRVLKPISRLISKTTHFVLKLFKIQFEEEKSMITEEKIIRLIQSARKLGSVNVVEEEMIENVFAFDETLVGKVMTPLEDIFAIDIDAFDENEFFHEFYSRVPVYEETLDQVIGFLHLKDYVVKGDRSIKEILRPVHFIDVSAPIDHLFLEMQRLNEHIRMVVDTDRKIVGLVTTEDLIEEIFGPIYDEYDTSLSIIEEVSPGCFQMNGKLSLKDFNTQFNTKLYSKKSLTIGAYLKERIGKLPRNTDYMHFEFEGHHFDIVKIRHKEVETIKYYRNN